MKPPPVDIASKALDLRTYLFRGRPFRTRSFDILEPAGEIVLRAKPSGIISSGDSIYSSQGLELVSCRNTSSFKDAYISGVFRHEFKDTTSTLVMGGLAGSRNSNSPDGVEWFILDPLETRIGRVMQEATFPEVRRGGKPIYDVMTGWIGDDKVFAFKVDLNSHRFEMSVDFSMDGGGALDRKLGLALAVTFAGMKRTRSDET